MKKYRIVRDGLLQLFVQACSFNRKDLLTVKWVNMIRVADQREGRKWILNRIQRDKKDRENERLSQEITVLEEYVYEDL